jgi:two-component system nitrate/nitrite response regulator NarL
MAVASIESPMANQDPCSPVSGLARALPIQIVIVDEQPIFRDGLRRLLETAPGLRIAADTSARRSAVLLEELKPDIVLFGLSPGSGPLSEDLVAVLRSARSLRTILLTHSLEAPEVLKAMRVGAYGVIPKDADAQTLFKSIDSVMAGHYWVGHERVANVTDGVRRLDNVRRRLKAFGLTRRELEIVRAVMDGDTNKEIASRLSISENTVKRHITHIFNKMGASTRLELALFAAHHLILDTS